MKTFTAFSSGLLFALGLGISGMTSPDKIIGFLALRDFSLVFVMGGALAVFAIARLFILRRARPLFDARFHLPEQTHIDAQLLGGSALFGVGWGLSGICPGPALLLLATGRLGVFAFVAGMLSSAWLTRLLTARKNYDTPAAVQPGPIV